MAVAAARLSGKRNAPSSVVTRRSRAFQIRFQQLRDEILSAKHIGTRLQGIRAIKFSLPLFVASKISLSELVEPKITPFHAKRNGVRSD